MRLRYLSLAASLALILSQTGEVFAASVTPRTCGAIPPRVFEQNSIPPGGVGGTGHESILPIGGIGGTGHETNTPPGGIGGTAINANNASSGIGGTGHELAIPPGGIGGTGHETTTPPGGIGGTAINANNANGGIGGTGHELAIPPGGIGGTRHETNTPPGGIGGTGIMAAGTLVNVNGVVTVEDVNKQQIQLAIGDEVCVGDKIATSMDAKAKILFTDGAVLYVLKNTDISLVDYNYSSQEPEQNRSLVALSKGDIRSVSGQISKMNPKHYGFSTPVSSVHVIGTDFLVTHLTQQTGALDAGTYTKVISGEISVQSATSTIRLRAGESSHVMLNGMQSVISSGGGTCTAP